MSYGIVWLRKSGYLCIIKFDMALVCYLRKVLKMKRKQMRTAIIVILMATAMTTEAQETAWPKISGFLNARYQYSDEAGSVQGFDIRRVRLAADGRIGQSLEYRVQAEYETSVKILDAYLKWNIAPSFNLQLGQFKAPFSQESYYSPTVWLTIDNPTVVSKLNGYNDLSGIKSNGRDIGFVVFGGLFRQRGGFDLLSYKIGIFNGNGINATAKKNDKDLAGIICLNPIKQLTLSVGHYQGDTHVRNRTSAGVEYKNKSLTVRSEYIHGNTAGMKSDGVYAEAAYFVTPRLQPVIEYDYFKQNKNVDGDQNNYQIGLNYLPIKNVRIQTAYTHKVVTGNDAVNYVAAQLIVKF
jgi:hypothetical protein